MSYQAEDRNDAAGNPVTYSSTGRAAGEFLMQPRTDSEIQTTDVRHAVRPARDTRLCR
jgi:hypothetical protein